MSCFYDIDSRSSFDPRVSNWNIHSKRRKKTTTNSDTLYGWGSNYYNHPSILKSWEYMQGLGMRLETSFSLIPLWSVRFMVDNKERIGLVQYLIIHRYSCKVKVSYSITIDWCCRNLNDVNSPSRYCFRSAFSLLFSSSRVCFSWSRASLSSNTLLWRFQKFSNAVYSCITWTIERYLSLLSLVPRF